MRRGTHLRLDRKARAADRLARSVGMRFVHRATDPVAMRGMDPREGFLVDMDLSHILDVMPRESWLHWCSRVTAGRPGQPISFPLSAIYAGDVP